jgi:hypothetical protein
VDARVAELLGHRAGDPRQDALRISHLASMSSRLDCDDDDEQSPGNEDVIHVWRRRHEAAEATAPTS